MTKDDKQNYIQYVNSRTRARKIGKNVYCPHCIHEMLVYHFSFTGLTCLGCRKEIQKNELVLSNNGIKNAKVS